MTEPHTSPVSDCLFFTKQPILDINRSIWGYELLGGEIKEGITQIFSREASVASLSSSTYVGLQEAMERGKKIMVGFDDASILSGVPHALPPIGGVVRVMPSGECSPDVDTALQNLRAEGYQTAREVIPGVPPASNSWNETDILAVDLGVGDLEAIIMGLETTLHPYCWPAG